MSDEPMDVPASARPDRPGDPCVMVIFGGRGDLARRKLLPALQNLGRYGYLNEQFSLIGFARTPMTDDEFREMMDQAVKEFGSCGLDPKRWEAMRRNLHYVSGDFDDPGAFSRLRERLEQVREETGIPGNTLFYCATPPDAFGLIAAELGVAGLVSKPGEGAGWTLIIIEKPFGRDLASARELNQQLLRVFDESQIYRIDHYQGKETVQNLLLFRFINGIFEPIWNRRYVDHVQITVSETVGMEGRGAYYDHAGALRDMLENHMLQLLCLVAMEPPLSMSGDDIRDEKVKVLRAVRPMDVQTIRRDTVRAQYSAGSVEGKLAVGFREEPKVAPDSATETYAAAKLFVDNWRWMDVPFYFRTGKRLGRKDTEVVVQFKRAPQHLVAERGGQPLRPNRLVIHIQPDERITWYFYAKCPGPTVRLKEVEMDFRYSDLEDSCPTTGYETLLYGAMVGDASLFHRSDMVEAAWQIATPILRAWEAHPEDVRAYPAGSWGPPEADELMKRDGRSWTAPN